MFQKLSQKFDLWFVPEWRRCLKLFSVQFYLVTALLLEAVQMSPVLPPEVQAMIPQPYAHIAIGIWTILALYTRLKSQQPAIPHD